MSGVLEKKHKAQSQNTQFYFHLCEDIMLPLAPSFLPYLYSFLYSMYKNTHIQTYLAELLLVLRHLLQHLGQIPHCGLWKNKSTTSTKHSFQYCALNNVCVYVMKK